MSNFNSVGFKTYLGLSLIAASASLGMSGCNSSGIPNNSENCSVSQSGGNEVITCPDGSSTIISNGQTGGSGAQGLGSGIFSTVIASDDQRCLQGNGGVAYSTFIDYNNTGVYASNDTITSTNYICNGATGTTGATGASGADGTNSSISLIAATTDECPTGGWEVTATNGDVTSPAYPLCNGATGATGATGAAAPTSPLSLVQLIAPCGEASSAYKEELLLLSDGSLLADFSGSSSADDVRLSLIPDGTYEDTDDSGCVFQVSTSGDNRSISWGAGSSGDDPSGWTAGGWTWSMPVGASGAIAL